jgi:hypothetical protein
MINIHQRTIGLFTNPLSGPGSIGSDKQWSLSPPIVASSDSLSTFRPIIQDAIAENDKFTHIERSVLSYPGAQMSFRKRKTLDRLNLLEPSDTHVPLPAERPWYMRGGKIRPQASADQTSKAEVWPEDLPGEDRIPDQLMYIPNGLPDKLDDPAVPLKKILLWNGISSWGGLRAGRGEFLKQQCPVNTCAITSSRTETKDAELVIFKDHFTHPTIQRPLGQIWMMYLLECPLHTQTFKTASDFNWTATYRSDSTVVAPYERWQYFNENVRTKAQDSDYAANKTKAVAWFVSNCGARNGRLQYAKGIIK